MTAGWLSGDLQGGCAQVDFRCDPPRLMPQHPPAIGGNYWFACLAALGSLDAPTAVDLVWPPPIETPGRDYPDNHSFAEALDRAIFLDEGDGCWRRVEDVTRQADGVRIVLPPGPAGRRLAVGMPVVPRDLDALLDSTRRHEAALVEPIAVAAGGSDLHAIVIDGGATDGTFLISAYQHFSEWAGIRMIDTMLRRLLGEGGEALRRYRWIFYPCINADAMRLGWRGDRHATEGINLNRDWGPFEQPETRGVRDHLVRELSAGPPLLHALDLHMGWHSRQTCGAGLTVFQPDAAPAEVIARQEAFTRLLYDRADYTDFMWRHGGVDRPNLAGWTTRTFACIGQTLEVSRHRWWLRTRREWVPPQADLERDLGLAVMESLVIFHSVEGGS